MKRHRKSGLAVAALVVLGVAACFDDPTSSLREGPALLSLNRTSVTVRFGDSVAVEATLRDAQGNPLSPAGITWTSADPNVAVVNLDAARPIPGDAFSRAIVRGAAANGGVTTVTVSAQGQTASFRVLVLPAALNGTVAVTGTPRADTIVINRPGLPPLVTVINRGDTLVITPPSGVTFSTTSSVVRLGAQVAQLLRRTADTLKVFARLPFAGRPEVTNLTFVGNAETGPVSIASLTMPDSIQVSRARFRGTVTVVGDTIELAAGAGSGFATNASVRVRETFLNIFSNSGTVIRAMAPNIDSATITAGMALFNYTVGAATIDSVKSQANVTVPRPSFPNANATVSGDTLIVNAPAGTSFDTSASPSVVRFGNSPGIVFVRTGSQMKVLSNINYNGVVTVTRLRIGTGLMDSLKTTGSISIARSTYPGTVTTNGNLLDTVRVTNPSGVRFTTTGTVSQVQIGGLNAYVLSRDTSQMVVIPANVSTGPITVTNIRVGGSTLPSLQTPGNVVIGPATGEANEPGNNARAGATALGTVAVNDSIVRFGTISSADAFDWYSFTGGDSLNVSLLFQGNGANPDIDVYLRDSAGVNLGGFAGATLANPEVVARRTAYTGTFHVRIDFYDYGTSTRNDEVYRLRILRRP